jgi:hypothetical protein
MGAKPIAPGREIAEDNPLLFGIARIPPINDINTKL